MADRTLVAYDRDGGYELHYAHDGVAADALGPATPFGGVTDRDLSRLRERLEPLGIDLPTTAGPQPAVEPTPIATVDAWETVLVWLDYRGYDKLHRVDSAWNVTPFLVCYFGLGERGGEERDPHGDGALLPLDSVDETYARGWFEGMKSTVGDALSELFDESRARAYMAARVRSFADGRAYVAGA